jgi:predicted MPP superfamily phosphohydrolase
MARPRRSFHRIRVVVFFVTTLIQLPALSLLSSVGARHGTLGAIVPYLLAVALTTPYLMLMLGRPFTDQPKPAWLRYLVMMPFFTWWATSAIYFFLGGIVYAIARLCHADSTVACQAALGISALGGLWSASSGPRLVELEVKIAGLPPAFDGYRVAQISDIHCGSFTPKRKIDGWVTRLNAARPDLIAVTGDLVTSGDAFTDDVVASLSALDAPDGVFACMGNHDYFCDAERLVAGLREGGIRVLRNEGEHIERDGTRLYIAGVEDTWTGRQDLPRTLADRHGATTLLLAHDPNHFPSAAEAGVDLTLSGHTHGGQLGLPGGRYNLARLITRFTHGLYSEGRSQLYVNRGAGTTGPPLRLFAPAELTVLTLRT